MYLKTIAGNLHLSLGTLLSLLLEEEDRPDKNVNTP